MNRKIRFVKFANQLMSISPKYINIFGNNVPGLFGSSAFTTGGFTPATMITDDLRSTLADFAKAYTAQEQNKKEIASKAKHLEGLIMAEQTINNLTADQAEKLIEELHDLIEEKGD